MPPRAGGLATAPRLAVRARRLDRRGARAPSTPPTLTLTPTPDPLTTNQVIGTLGIKELDDCSFVLGTDTAPFNKYPDATGLRRILNTGTQAWNPDTLMNSGGMLFWVPNWREKPVLSGEEVVVGVAQLGDEHGVGPRDEPGKLKAARQPPPASSVPSPTPPSHTGVRSRLRRFWHWLVSLCFCSCTTSPAAVYPADWPAPPGSPPPSPPPSPRGSDGSDSEEDEVADPSDTGADEVATQFDDGYVGRVSDLIKPSDLAREMLGAKMEAHLVLYGSVVQQTWKSMWQPVYDVESFNTTAPLPSSVQLPHLDPANLKPDADVASFLSDMSVQRAYDLLTPDGVEPAVERLMSKLVGNSLVMGRLEDARAYSRLLKSHPSIWCRDARRYHSQGDAYTGPVECEGDASSETTQTAAETATAAASTRGGGLPSEHEEDAAGEERVGYASVYKPDYPIAQEAQYLDWCRELADQNKLQRYELNGPSYGFVIAGPKVEWYRCDERGWRTKYGWGQTPRFWQAGYPMEDEPLVEALARRIEEEFGEKVT